MEGTGPVSPVPPGLFLPVPPPNPGRERGGFAGPHLVPITPAAVPFSSYSKTKEVCGEGGIKGPWHRGAPEGRDEPDQSRPEPPTVPAGRESARERRRRRGLLGRWERRGELPGKGLVLPGPGEGRGAPGTEGAACPGGPGAVPPVAPGRRESWSPGAAHRGAPCSAVGAARSLPGPGAPEPSVRRERRLLPPVRPGDGRRRPAATFRPPPRDGAVLRPRLTGSSPVGTRRSSARGRGGPGPVPAVAAAGPGLSQRRFSLFLPPPPPRVPAVPTVFGRREGDRRPRSLSRHSPGCPTHGSTGSRRGDALAVSAPTGLYRDSGRLDEVQRGGVGKSVGDRTLWGRGDQGWEGPADTEGSGRTRARGKEEEREAGEAGAGGLAAPAPPIHPPLPSVPAAPAG